MTSTQGHSEMNRSAESLLEIILREKGETIPLARDENELAFLYHWLSLTGDPVQPVSEPRDSLSIRDIIASCSKCGRVSERKYPAGTGLSRVMVILNSPRLLSRVERNLYKEESISMLKKMIELLGLMMGDVYMTNLVKCEVDDALSRTSSIVNNCEEILLRELELISPEIAVLFGDIIPLQKIVKSTTGVFWFNIDHPVTLIKNPELKRGAWNTLQNVKKQIELMKDKRE